MCDYTYELSNNQSENITPWFINTINNSYGNRLNSISTVLKKMLIHFVVKNNGLNLIFTIFKKRKVKIELLGVEL